MGNASGGEMVRGGSSHLLKLPHGIPIHIMPVWESHSNLKDNNFRGLSQRLES